MVTLGFPMQLIRRLAKGQGGGQVEGQRKRKASSMIAPAESRVGHGLRDERRLRSCDDMDLRMARMKEGSASKVSHLQTCANPEAGEEGGEGGWRGGDGETLGRVS